MRTEEKLLLALLNYTTSPIVQAGILEGLYADECVEDVASTCKAFRDAMARVAVKV